MSKFTDWFKKTETVADEEVGKYAEKHFYQKWQVYVGLVVVAALAFFIAREFM